MQGGGVETKEERANSASPAGELHRKSIPRPSGASCVNGILWTAGLEIPAEGAPAVLGKVPMNANLDTKVAAVKEAGTEGVTGGIGSERFQIYPHDLSQLLCAFNVALGFVSPDTLCSPNQ